MIKAFSIVFMLGMSVKAFSICSAPLSRTNAGYGAVLTSARYNAELNAVFNRANNLPGDCIADGSLSGSKLAPGSITNSKIADGAVTANKLAPGAIPVSGRLIRVSPYTLAGTWTWSKSADVGFIMVQVVGGGGASFHSSSTDGAASSFGSHCIAYGGLRPTSGGFMGPGGLGGSAISGDINLTGGNGDTGPASGFGYYGSGGLSMLGFYGMGGTGSASAVSGGGGSGGYCAKVIQKDALSAVESVTVGAGGSNPGGSTTPGKNGIVMIYEYSL